jgi:phosphoribosyl-AMP cyclohydrolase / phosphoribosyl-ATP pyrophosphohydrolase
MSWLDQLQFDEDGLIPVIAQEANSGEVLMLAFANRTALESTIRSGRAHYWSRSRGSLWAKGETSGHVQQVVEVRIDCDGDAVLYRVEQTGPACHTLNRSCFFRRIDGDELVEGGAAAHVLSRVDEVVADRRENPKPGAYTTYLFEQGIDKILKKIGEESTEVVIAAKNDSLDELTAETSDLFFHLLVLLRARNLPLESVWREMEDRFGRPPRPRGKLEERKGT